MPIRSKKIFIISLAVIILAGGLFWFAGITKAQTQTAGPDLGLAQVSSTIGLPTTDIRVIVANIIRAALGLLGIVALVLILYGGFVWMTAGGNEEKLAQAKKILINATIGLLIMLCSYAITSFIISKLVSATTGVPEHCTNGIQDSGETAVDCGGGGCASCSSSGGNPYFTSGVFYVNALPAGGQLCIRNVYPAITFNMNVDEATLSGNVVLLDKNNNEQAGTWKVVDGNTAEFVPTGDCGAPDNGTDCLIASANYTLHFKNGASIKSADGRTLSCLAGVKCNDVSFITGEGIDRNPPTVKIETIPDDKLVAGQVVPVKVDFTDDNGVQKIDLKSDNNYVGSQTITGCQKTGTVTINWPTVGLSDGVHGLDAKGYDWSMQVGTDHYDATLKPPHCFDNLLNGGEDQAGPPGCCATAKNCGCGSCGGSSCTQNSDCSSGFCKITTGQTTGVCVNAMRITGVSPGSGAPGTYVSISGEYFGGTQGKVYFTSGSGWVEAQLADCGPQTWKSWQVIVTVPQGATNGPIKLITADNQFSDVTNDNFGSQIPDFTVNDVIRPGICSLDKINGLPGEKVTASGKNFGQVQAAGTVSFGQLQAFAGSWTDNKVTANVPMLAPGPVAVKITKNTIDSNGVAFFVGEGISSTTPIITDISPDQGAQGEYITITGNNFGDQQGRVWFKTDNNGQPADDASALEGDFATFPVACQNNTWTDNKIIVKFPANLGQTGQTYFVQVRPSEIDKGWSPVGPTFKLTSGSPNPGICSITPSSGPVPFAANSYLKISGEYFGSSPDVYFWNNGASDSAISGRTKADGASFSPDNAKILNVNPPAATLTGPIVVYRSSDQKMSNSALFTVSDCVKNGNACVQANFHCCAAGPEAGMCKSDLCTNEKLSAGYIWRFATQPIPQVPHLIERCNSATDEGKNVPSPSPSILWDTNDNGDQHNVCRTASVVLDFSVSNMNPIPVGDIVVSECQKDTVNASTMNCTQALPPVSLKITGEDGVHYALEHSANGTDDLELNLDSSYNGGKWMDNTWYQVVLKSDISAGSGTSLVNLAKDAPCDVPGSAYCFLFKTDSKDCKIRAVAVTPSSFWTTVLEEPVKYRTNPADAGTDLVYSGHVVSDQHCIWMNPGGLSWNWSSEDSAYAKIFGATTDIKSQVSALANTVGVLTPDNSVNIDATVLDNAEGNKTGHSPLTIDLSNPQVLDFWPQCNQACTNAEVGARFNTTMSDKNLNTGVHLYKCGDENCSAASLVEVNLPTAPGFDQATLPSYTLLQIDNYGLSSVNNELEPNTIYEVVLSASSSDPGSQLWSAASLTNRASYSKPYNQKFTWKFTTKKEKCVIARTEVLPSVFTATRNSDRAVFQVQPYSSPDACSATGQKLDPWSVNWTWKSSDVGAAKISTFSTSGFNPFCTKDCVKRGSTYPAGVAAVPVCGNGKVEAGEDCDPPGKNGSDPSKYCGLNCLFVNKTNIGSVTSVGATSVSSSVCGNGFVGAGEDCDTGITADPLKPTSALNCTSQCLHTGTPLASSWCASHASDYTSWGFTKDEYQKACVKAVSQCGDGILSPDEDPGCDGSGGWDSNLCTANCLLKTGRNAGSSLLYATPSVCGDKVIGTGEDATCETDNFITTDHAGTNDPWVLAIGVGTSQNVGGTPPTQRSTITAATAVGSANISGDGQFVIPCGYKSDAECQAAFGGNGGESWGLAANSCCYKSPNLIKVYPGAITSPPSVAQNICPNTAIEAEFDQIINTASLPGNLLIARGVFGPAPADCQDVTALVQQNSNNKNIAWYQKVWQGIIGFLQKLFGGKAMAQSTPDEWCAGGDLGTPTISTTTQGSKISVQLLTPLATNTYYAIILKDGIKDNRGISIGRGIFSGGNSYINWKFITAAKICEINSVNVTPGGVNLSSVGATSILTAQALAASGNEIQPIPGYYDWNFVWGPKNNAYVTLQDATVAANTITAQNRNGELDVWSSANIIANKYTSAFGSVATGKSHVIVFLCENPWPPKNPIMVFPYEDKVGNNDNYDLTADSFDGQPALYPPYYNFRTYYCADNGAVGTADDLPYMRVAIQTKNNALSGLTPLKRFIFTNAKNNDAIGIQVFPNLQHLTVSDWYNLGKSEGGQGFTGNMQPTIIDGYDALSDGNNIYVDALNYATTTVSTGDLYTNIYLFSINADAQPETRKVFEQIMNNLHFNTNLTNYQRCGVNVENPGDTKCQTDMDCTGGQICSAQIDKLKRNYQRLRDLNGIQKVLGQ